MSLEIKTGINPKEYFPDSKHIIIYAFSIVQAAEASRPATERHYFRFDDMLNIPYNRGLQTLVYYKEMGMNCDRDYLKAHATAFDNALSKETINIQTLVDLKVLNDQLKQRLELPKEPDLMYKFASVVFFDQFENPEIYEFKYGENKIRAWKKSLSLQSFFLSKPLVELIPYLKYSGESLQQFSEMTARVTKEHLDNISAMLSDEQKTLLRNRFS